MTSHDVRFGGTGIPETILPAEAPEILSALSEAAELDGAERHAATQQVVAASPRSLQAWAALGDYGRETVEAYSAYRIGYHRGLDTLRQNGWRGSGYVRWVHPTNRAFLRCLAGLERCASEIGEVDEVERCALFLRQLEPSWPPADI